MTPSECSNKNTAARNIHVCVWDKIYVLCVPGSCSRAEDAADPSSSENTENTTVSLTLAPLEYLKKKKKENQTISQSIAGSSLSCYCSSAPTSLDFPVGPDPKLLNHHPFFFSCLNVITCMCFNWFVDHVQYCAQLVGIPQTLVFQHRTKC